jgi:tetratricopeptide (TPR) repeat protein
MPYQQPAQSRSFLVYWVGFFLIALPALAQTPVPPRPPAAPPAQQTPVAPPKENGQQLVRKAESLLRQTPAEHTEQALNLYQTAAAAFHQSGEIEAEALTWHRIAHLAAQAGSAPLAKSAAAKARTLLRVRTLPTRSTAGLSSSQAARAYLTLGRIHLESGEAKEAIEAYQAGLSLAVTSQLHREAAAGHVALGLIAAQGEELEVAIRMTLKSLDFWRAAKDFSGEAMALNNLARFYERKGELKLAANFDADAINLLRFSRNHKAEGDSLVEAMRLHLIMGNHDEAALACEQLIALARLSGDQQKEHERTMTLALLEAQRDNLPSAYRLLLKALIGSSQTNSETTQQIKEFAAKLAATKAGNTQQGREQILAEVEFEARRGDFSAAYQLLLRALLMNEGKSDVMNAALNTRIKALAKQIEAQQKRLSVTRPARFD